MIRGCPDPVQDRKPSNGAWSPGWEGKPFGFCSSTTTSSRGGKKMWCVAELNEEYISKMEDVLETYEKPYDPSEPVVCLDEKPVSVMASPPFALSFKRLLSAAKVC